MSEEKIPDFGRAAHEARRAAAQDAPTAPDKAPTDTDRWRIIGSAKVLEIESSLQLNPELGDAADFWNEALAEFSERLIAYIEEDERDE